MDDFNKLANVEAEQALLGSVMSKPDCIAEVMSRVKPDAFYRETNRLIYLAMRKMATNGTRIDLVTIAEELRATETLDKIGGLPVLTQILSSNYTTANNDEYIRIINTMAKRRQLIRLADTIRAAAGDTSAEINPGEWQSKIAELAVCDDAKVKTLDDEFIDFMAELDRRRTCGGVGIMSGFPRLDINLKGWQPSQLIVLAARPSVGKSALALTFAVNAALAGKKVAFFSLEMSKFELIARAMAFRGNINMSKFVDGSLSENEYNSVLKTMGTLTHKGIFFFDKISGKPSELSALCKMIQLQHGLDLVIIDYLQLMRPDRQNSNHAVEVGDISWALKQLAMRLNVPVIALSQLNRAVESRQDKKPMLADLRDSGNIEQDANVVMALYKDDTAGDEMCTHVNIAVLKNRNGPLCNATLDFFGQFMKFVPAQGEPVNANEIPS